MAGRLRRFGFRWVLVWGSGVIGTLASAIAWAGASEPSGRALVRDVVKIVEIREQAGWGIDEYEFRDAISTVLSSVCRASEETRGAAQELLGTRLMTLGGHPQGQIGQGATSWKELKEVMTVWRAQELLERATREIANCPFWIQSSATFRGLHSDEGRFSFGAAGGGLFLGRRLGSGYRFGAGGGGRFTLGYGIAPDWHLRVGAGFGGGALADRTIDPQNVDIDFYMDVPLILGHSDTLWRHELEVAFVTLGVPSKSELQYGVRFGGLIGMSFLRIRDVMPWTGLLVYGEHIFARSGLPAAWTIRAGARFGFSWSPTGDGR